MNIALFLPNWVGDVVMATPAIDAVRRHHPGARLVGVMRPYVAGVVEGATWFDAVLLDNGRTPATSLPAIAWKLRREKIDVAVLFTNSFRSALAAWLGGCRRVVGYTRDRRAWLLTSRLEPERNADGTFAVRPVIDAYNRLAERLGCPWPGYQMRVFTTPADESLAECVWRHYELDRAETVIALNPGAAYGSAKHWPAAHFAELARRFAAQPRTAVLVLCGPNERGLARDIVKQADCRRVVSLASEAVSLGLLKACVRRAHLLVTTDSGPRHFATAFNRPVVTLFGPTHIEWTETYHPLAVHLQKKVPCGPCQQRTCPLTGPDHHRCMKELTPCEVYAAATALLARCQRRADPRRRAS